MGKEVSALRQPGCWLRSSHSSKECVIAHWPSTDAPKINGAKIHRRSAGSLKETVGEQSVNVEAEERSSVERTEERMLA